MNAHVKFPNTEQYQRAVSASKTVRWDIEADVIRGRTFDLSKKFLPDGLSMIDTFASLSPAEKRLVSQIQGRTYACIFGLVERFITAKLLEIGRDHWLGDQNALEALVRFSEEELKHQALFRRIEAMIDAKMPAGYVFDVDADQVAAAVLSKSTWSVLLLTLHIELFVQNHYRESIGPDESLSDLFKDVFLFHWKDECQHVVLDELELTRHDAALADQDRDRGVDDFIDLVCAVDGILQAQAKADAGYFTTICGRPIGAAERADLVAQLLKAYRWQYIFSGASHPRFQAVLTDLIDGEQFERIGNALSALC
jgi:hypothetical protein